MHRFCKRTTALCGFRPLVLAIVIAATVVVGSATSVTAPDEQTAVDLITDVNQGDKSLAGEAAVRRPEASHGNLTNADVDDFDSYDSWLSHLWARKSKDGETMPTLRRAVSAHRVPIAA